MKSNRLSVIYMITLFLTAISLNSCTKDYEKINTQPDAIIADQLGSAQIGQVFARVQYTTMTSSFEVTQNLFADMFSQYYALTRQSFNSDRYVNVASWASGAFSAFYSGVGKDLSFIESLSEKNQLPLQNAVIKVWKANAYHRITDYWGPVPYSEVGSGKVSIKYDTQESIYTDLFKILDEAIVVLKANQGKTVFAADDLLYKGDVNKWLAFANSLKLRLALRIKYANPALAKTHAEKAVADGVMLANSGNAFVFTSINNLDPLGNISNFDNWRMSTSMESIMVGYDDPRISQYWEPVVVDLRKDGRQYHGLRNGQKVEDMSGGPQNESHSKIDIKWWQPARGGSNPPLLVMNAAEVYFLRAEGALAGWSMGGTAQALYEKGIETSIQQTTTASAGVIASYISSTKIPVAINDVYKTPAVSNIPVAYGSTGTAERQLEQIITQKWIAMFPNGWEAWTEARRTGYPKYLPRLNSDNPDVPKDVMIRRINYSEGEVTSNPDGLKAAQALPELASRGGDKNSTRLWWDKKP
ncbi:MAG: SusD/RagB family nutrient-binding outer membrane lipoprotein [Bacteroidota bacterium]